MSKHSAAPWTFDADTGQVDCPGGTVVQPGAIPWLEDGQLIQAGPELLAACKRARLAMTALGNELNWPEDVFVPDNAIGAEYAAAMRALDEATAKAEG